MSPDTFTFVHEQISEGRWDLGVFMGNGSVDGCGKCWSVEDVWRVLNNNMFLGHVKCRQGRRHWNCFNKWAMSRSL
jgi:hypothetical protein